MRLSPPIVASLAVILTTTTAFQFGHQHQRQVARRPSFAVVSSGGGPSSPHKLSVSSSSSSRKASVADETASSSSTEKSLGLEYPPISHFGKDATSSSSSSSTLKNPKAILGGKGANLAEMSSIGLAVPPGFTRKYSIVFDEEELDQINFKSFVLSHRQGRTNHW